MNFNKLKIFYQNHLQDVLFPFWINFGIDKVNGGFYTCFSNDGSKLTSTNKYIWSQGRFLWMLSRAGSMSFLPGDMLKQFKKAADQGASFLKEHALLPNGHSAWVLDSAGRPITTDRNGAVINPENESDYERGITADLFLIYGMAEYARFAGNQEYFVFALDLFESVYQRLMSGNYLSFPHNEPAGFTSHGNPMILLETAQELASVSAFFSDPSEERLRIIAIDSMNDVLNNFVQYEDRILLEMIDKESRKPRDDKLGSYFNPGHSIEDAWFIMHLARTIGDNKALLYGTEIVRWMVDKGWDGEYGGLFQFVHKDGGKPRGTIAEANINEHMLSELDENWDNKLWWVHSEALYALILSYEHSQDDWFLNAYEKMHKYTFSTFPNPDNNIGEWLQIMDRQGKPVDKVVALPVKDPYHITRAFMHIVLSLERMTSTEEANCNSELGKTELSI